MIGPAVVRECRTNFESLPDSVDGLLRAYWEDGHWILVGDPERPKDNAERAALHARVRLFFTNFGVRVLGAAQEQAFDACLDQIKERLPHYFSHASHDSYSSVLQNIPFAQIEPPEPGQLGRVDTVVRPADAVRENRFVDAAWAADAMRRETQGLPPHDAPLTLVVERHGDRFVIVDGHYLYETVKALEQPLVKCYVGTAVHSRTETGNLERLKTAAVELCEQIAIEASWVPIASTPAASAAPPSTDAQPSASAPSPVDASKLVQSVPTDLIGVQDAAALCDVNYDTVLKWIHAGSLQQWKVGPVGSRESIRVSRRDVEGLIRPG